MSGQKRRVAKIIVGAEQIRFAHGLPAGYTVLAVNARFDPPAYEVLVGSDKLPEVDEGFEAPVINGGLRHSQIELSPVIRLAAMLKSLPDPIHNNNTVFIDEVFTFITELAGELERVGETNFMTRPRLHLGYIH